VYNGDALTPIGELHSPLTVGLCRRLADYSCRASHANVTSVLAKRTPSHVSEKCEDEVVVSPQATPSVQA